jgi:hypothetical protein
MARLIPDDLGPYAFDPGAHAGEIETLRALRDGLGDDYSIYHGVTWARVQRGASVFGEIDFIVAHRSGWLLAIEQKDAPVAVRDGDLVASYRGPAARQGAQNKSVTVQLARNLNALRSEFARRHDGRQLVIDHLLYLPRARLAGALPAGIAPERVLDADGTHSLAQTVVALHDAASVPLGGAEWATPLEIEDFLAQKVRAEPHIGLLGRSAREFSSRAAEGLSTWASRLSLTPWRLRVRGTAGSGKTQLALQMLRAAHRSREQALYVCFNRPLADAMRAVAPDPATAVTFHELAALALAQTGQTPDFTAPGVFDAMSARLAELAPALADTFATLIVDEGQDFEPAWAQSLLKLVREDGRVLWLEDPRQALYGRAPVELPGWAVLESPVNYRSPRRLVEFMNWMQLCDETIEAGSGIEGEDPLWRLCEDDEDPAAQTGEAVRALLDQGYAPASIAVLSFRGLERSRIAGPDGPLRLAGLAISRPAGFDAQGAAMRTAGTLLVDTVYRFKGRAADAVVLTEIDFEALDEAARRRLFVGITRARLQVALVTSRRASAAMLDALGGPP